MSLLDVIVNFLVPLTKPLNPCLCFSDSHIHQLSDAVERVASSSPRTVLDGKENPGFSRRVSKMHKPGHTQTTGRPSEDVADFE